MYNFGIIIKIETRIVKLKNGKDLSKKLVKIS